MRAAPRFPAGMLVLMALGLHAGVAAPSAAQSPTPALASSLRSETDTTLVTVGDRINLTVTVEHPVGAEVVWPDSLDVAPFELLDARVAPSRTQGDRAISTARLTLTTFELGALEMPSFEVVVRGVGGEEERLATDRFGIEVVSVGVDENGDIREIRGPFSIPIGALRVSAALLALLAAAALAYALVRRLRGRTTEGAPAEAPARPAHEVALEALDRLLAGPLLGSGAVKEFHIEASEILRRYLEARYHVTALEMTTVEIVDGLRRVGVDGDFGDRLRSVLDRCDLVKFAKVRPGTDACRDLVDRARRLVVESKPPRTTVETEASAPATAGAPDPAVEGAR